MKRKIKSIISLLTASIALFAFFSHFYPRWAKPHIPCLLLHHIGEPLRASDLWAVSHESFLSVLDRLVQKKVRTLSLAEVRHTVAKGELPKDPPYVFLTFDDGCRSHLTVVLPELQKRNMRATFFVTIPPSGTKEFLGSEGVRKLSQQSEVQSHTRTFQTLPKKAKETKEQYEKRLNSSLVDFRTDLAQLTGKEVYALAYPSGEYDGDIMERAQKAGYELCFTTDYGTIGPKAAPLELPRFMVTKGTTIDEIENFIKDDELIHGLAALSCLLLALSCFFVALDSSRS